MPLLVLLLIATSAFLGGGFIATRNKPTSQPEVLSFPEETISSPIPTQVTVPTIPPTMTIFPSVTPTLIIFPPTQEPTQNIFKELKLKQIESRINEINRTISSYQSNINYYLKQEEIQCNFSSTPQYFQPESPPALPGETITPYPTRLIDPGIDNQFDYQCSMSFFSLVGELRAKITNLENEKRKLEMEKIGL